MPQSSYNKVHIPLTVNLGIESFAGTTINQFSSYMKNCVVEEVGPEPNNVRFARHRPAFITAETNSYASFGYQIVDVGGAITGATATGLANDATEYTASISVDGTPNAIAVTGSTAQTYTDLISQINSDLTGATASLSKGNIRVSSDSSGASSTIAITDTDLFSTLTDYSSILTAVGGVASQAKTAGRGVYYWAATDTLYFVNDDSLFSDSYTHIEFISSGYKKVFFTEVGTSLFITDPENSEAWLLSSSDVLSAVTDAQFPSTLAYGIVTLNGRVYVMDEDGVIYDSDADDGSSWSALDFIEAERRPDGGLFIGPHHDDIVAIGPNTIEFFTDTANPTGSPLTRRQDIFYNVGGISGEAVWQVGDVIYFIGTEAKGSLSLFKLEKYELTKISSFGVNSYLTNLVYRSAKGVYLSGFQAQGNTYVLINPYDTDNSSYADVYYTFALDTKTGFLYWFSSTLGDLGDTTSLHIVDWTLRTGNSIALGRGITSEGSVVSILDSLGAYDSSAGLYVESGYWVSGYAEGDTSDPSVNIPYKIRTGSEDFGSSNYKYPSDIQIRGDFPSTGTSISLSWSKTNTSDSAYISTRTLDISRRRRLKRLGRFVRISFDIDYSNIEPIRLEELEFNVAVGR